MVGWIGVLAGVVSVIATLFLVADDPDSLLGTPANLGGFLLAMLFILLLSIFMTIRLGKTEPGTKFNSSERSTRREPAPPSWSAHKAAPPPLSLGGTGDSPAHARLAGAQCRKQQSYSVGVSRHRRHPARSSVRTDDP